MSLFSKFGLIDDVTWFNCNCFSYFLFSKWQLQFKRFFFFSLNNALSRSLSSSSSFSLMLPLSSSSYFFSGRLPLSSSSSFSFPLLLSSLLLFFNKDYKVLRGFTKIYESKYFNIDIGICLLLWDALISNVISTPWKRIWLLIPPVIFDREVLFLI